VVCPPLIEKKGSFIGQFEAADFLRDRSSKSATFMTKELTFEQVEGNGGTIQLDQRVALTTPKPKARYAVVPQRFKNWTLPRLLPVRMLDAQLAKLLGLTKP